LKLNYAFTNGQQEKLEEQERVVENVACLCLWHVRVCGK